MRYFFMFLVSIVVFNLNAQETGSIVGKLIDKEVNDEPLAFANVLIKGTTKGTTSDFDGLYEITNMKPGIYVIVYSYLGYETIEISDVEVVAGKVTTINIPMSVSQGVALDEVVVITSARKDSETALLLDQKKAVEIKESIGGQELAKIGVSDAATATTKISGVSSSEASGNIFVRGLGDRYLSTTLNGLPVPSDDVEKKNIDLSLFPTRVIQNVSISKTYSSKSSADQSSGTINITSRELKGSSEFSVSLSGGVNSNVVKSGVWDDFKVSPNQSDAVLGFYSTKATTKEQITQQGWNTRKQDNPVDHSLSLSVGKKFNEKLSTFLTVSHSQEYGYTQGVYRKFGDNSIKDSITDATTFDKKIINTGLLDITYFLNEKNKLKSSTFFVNKLSESVFEGGRNGKALRNDETSAADGLTQFIRDQNTKQTRLLTTQLLGTHHLTEKNTVEWAGSFNLLNAYEPNRIRNEVNIVPNGSFVQFGRVGGFQQRKSNQKIEDVEYNGYLRDILQLINKENKSFKIELGLFSRNKTRDFSSEFVGLEETSLNAVKPISIDDIGAVIQQAAFDADLLKINLLGTNGNGENKDIYTGDLTSSAAYADFNLRLHKWNFNVGLRYQKDEIKVSYDIGNLNPRTGNSNKDYDNIYPSLHIKYALNDFHALRLAISRTITLPEFKEIAPFEYISPTGQLSSGNPELEASYNLNYDLKWEYFPSSGQLVSLSAFHKNISDPINRVKKRSASGVFSYFNSGNEADIYGLEAETKIALVSPIENDEDGSKSGYGLNLVFNATRMWHKQDLKEVFNENGILINSFRYNNNDEIGLQGASDWIFNTSLNFTSTSKNPFSAAITANYASDKIFALGVPNDQPTDVFYDDAIIEKGFVVLDAVISKKIGKHWSTRLTGKNLLNPEIIQKQKVKNINTNVETDRTVLSYSTGTGLSLGLNYSF